MICPFVSQAGRAEHSFGIEVARLAGLPSAVIDKAKVRHFPLAVINYCEREILFTAGLTYQQTLSVIHEMCL